MAHSGQNQKFNRIIELAESIQSDRVSAAFGRHGGYLANGGLALDRINRDKATLRALYAEMSIEDMRAFHTYRKDHA